MNKGDYVLDGAGNPQWDGGSYIIYDQNGNPQEVITRNQNRDRHVIWESELNDSRTIRNTLNGIGYLDLVLPYGFTATLKANVNTRNSIITNTRMRSSVMHVVLFPRTVPSRVATGLLPKPSIPTRTGLYRSSCAGT